MGSNIDAAIRSKEWSQLVTALQPENSLHVVPTGFDLTDIVTEPVPDEPSDHPTFVDVAALLSGDLPEPPSPTVCTREDGHALFYPGQLNNLFGDPECGKTWVALTAITEQLDRPDGRALFIDADHNGAEQIVSRLLDLGVPPGVLADPQRFRLADPEDSAHMRQIIDEACEWRPTVAVVDSIGELLPLYGMNSNSSDDFTSVVRRALRPLFRVGACVITIDHLAKSPDSRAAGPSGTAAKGRAIGGVSIRVHLREAFVPGRGGCAALSIKKDRPGGLRKVSPTVGGKEQPAGLFILDQRDGSLRWRITTPTADDALSSSELSGRGTWTVSPADLAELDGLPDDARSSVRRVKEATSWGSDRATATLAEWRALRGEDT